MHFVFFNARKENEMMKQKRLIVLESKADFFLNNAIF